VYVISLDTGIIMLLAVPLFDYSNKWCIDLPNVANVSFHFPSVLRVYMLAFIPGNTPVFLDIILNPLTPLLSYGCLSHPVPD